MREFIRRHWFPAATALLIFAPLTWWAFDVEPPVEIVSVVASDQAVKRGGNLLLDYDVIRRRECPGETQRVISDSKDIIHASEPYRFNSGVGREGRKLPLGNERFKVSAPVPFGAAPGPAKFQAIIEYWCNPVQRFFSRGIVVTLPVVPFVVLPDTAADITPPTRLPGAEPLPPVNALTKPPHAIIEKAP